MRGGLALAALGMTGGRMAVAASASHRFKVGAAEVTVLSDGVFTMPPDLTLPDTPAEQIQALFNAAGRDKVEFIAQTNVPIIRIGKEVILVDAGGGPDFIPGLGKLPERMAAADVAPASVTQVIFTHGHPDHLWGVMDEFGEASRFEAARHVMALTERDYWLAPGLETKVAARFQAMTAGTQRRLKLLADKVEAVKAGTEITPGVALMATPGHTPGHVAVSITSQKDRLLITGDALTQSITSFAAPKWRWGSDTDPDAAIATRERLLATLSSDKIPMLGYHLPWPGLGHVDKQGDAYKFVPAV